MSNENNNNNNNNNNNKENNSMSLYGLTYHDYDREQGDYYYEVEVVPSSNTLIFEKNRIVSTEKRLTEIDDVYTIDGKDCKLVDIGKLELTGEVENNRGFRRKTRETKRIYYVTPVESTENNQEGGKRSRRKTRKSKKTSKKSKKTRKH